MNPLLLLRREQRKNSLNFYFILLLDPVHQVVCLRKQEFSIDREEAEILAQARSHINQHHPFGPKRRRDGDIVSEGVKRPRQHLLRTPTLGRQLQFCDLVFHATGSLSVSVPCRGACEMDVLKSARGRKPSFPFDISGIANPSTRASGSANRTTSPTTSSVGAASCGVRCRSNTVVRWVR